MANSKIISFVDHQIKASEAKTLEDIESVFIIIEDELDPIREKVEQLQARMTVLEEGISP